MSSQYILFLMIAAAGGLLGNRLRFPAGTTMGALFAVGIAKYFSILDLRPSLTLSFLIQVLLGITLGVTLARIDLDEFRKMAGYLIVIVIGVIGMTIGVGYFAQLLTPLDKDTIFLSAAPGGLPEMSALAQELELNAPVIAVLHMSRLIIVLTVFPLLLRYFFNKEMGLKPRQRFDD